MKNGLLGGSQIECYCYYSGFFESKDIYAAYTALTPVNSQVHGSPIQCKECTHPISCVRRLNERCPDLLLWFVSYENLTYIIQVEHVND